MDKTYSAIKIRRNPLNAWDFIEVEVIKYPIQFPIRGIRVSSQTTNNLPHVMQVKRG